MKLFISHCDHSSNKIALLLSEWISLVLPEVTCQMSVSNASKANFWASEKTAHMSDFDLGLICLSPSNVDDTWIAFEAGVLLGKLSSDNIVVLLSGLEPAQLPQPFSMVQQIVADKAGILQLATIINNQNGTQKLDEKVLIQKFESHWTHFLRSYNTIVREIPEGKADSIKTQEELLLEILESIRRVDSYFEVSSNRPMLINDEHHSDMLQLLNTPIEAFDLRTRTYNALKGRNFNKIGDVAQSNPYELSKIRNMGPTAMAELKEVLAEAGLGFDMELSKYGF